MYFPAYFDTQDTYYKSLFNFTLQINMELQ